MTKHKQIVAQLLTFTALASISVGCGDDLAVTQALGDLKAETAIDFGDVQRGITSEIEFELRNEGDGTTEINSVEYGENWTTPDYEFKISDPRVSIGPNSKHLLKVSFQPLKDQESKVTSFFKLTYDCDIGDCKTFTVNVSGRGVTSGLIVEPDPVDFGSVLVGSSRTIDVKITNVLPIAVSVNTKIDGSGKAEIKNTSGRGRFEVVSPIQPNGSLLPEGDLLAPGGFITVQLRYVPDPSSSNQPDEGEWTISNCDNSFCKKKVKLTGQGTNSALECTPSQIDFGDVNPNASLTVPTTCKNIASESVTITGWRLAIGGSDEFSVAPYQGNPANLAPGAEFTVETTFSPTLTNVGDVLRATLEISGKNPRANRDLETTQIPLQGKAGGPDIEVTPRTLNFGQIVLGTVGKKRILVSNNGYSTLTISSINGDLAGTGNFTVDTVSDAIPDGGSKIIEVTFMPTNEGTVTSQVLIMSDDSDEPEVIVELTGEGLNLPPCRYSLEPVSLNLGIVQVLRETTQGFRIRNEGGDDCLIND
ncbi:MAG: choice-of-anchor D domain-containing protein, partial [Myxococcota bacterium]|nr:choice-of-anchor D domain-containing protein [Myxococcota bacterium]